MAALLQRAAEQGVERVIACAVDLESAELLTSWVAALPGLYGALGYHPWYLANLPENYLVRLLALTQKTAKVVAIGEIGLDGSIERPLEEQLPVFLRQLDLARELKLPAIIHARKAGQKVVDLLLARPAQPLVLHSFSGSFEQLEKLLARGQVYVSFSGSVTRPAARRIRTLAAKLPLEAMLLETDSPSINIENLPLGTVKPQHLKYVAQAIADIRGISLRELTAITDENSFKLFGKMR